MLDADERGVRAVIDRAIKGTALPGTTSVTRFGPSGRYRMVILRGDAAPADGAVQAAAHRWELTPRQSEVLVLLARGHSNRDIAETLGCALHTVELHVSAILAKAGVENRSALVAALHRTGP